MHFELVIMERLNGLLVERKSLDYLLKVERPCDNERSKEIE